MRRISLTLLLLALACNSSDDPPVDANADHPKEPLAVVRQQVESGEWTRAWGPVDPDHPPDDIHKDTQDCKKQLAANPWLRDKAFGLKWVWFQGCLQQKGWAYRGGGGQLPSVKEPESSP